MISKQQIRAADPLPPREYSMNPLDVRQQTAYDLGCDGHPDVMYDTYYYGRCASNDDGLDDDNHDYDRF